MEKSKLLLLMTELLIISGHINYSFRRTLKTRGKERPLSVNQIIAAS